MKQSWFVYIAQCSDNTFYTGITNNLERRIQEHNTSEKGAKYTRGRRPVALVYSESFSTRADAAKREVVIKSMKVQKKKGLFSGRK